MKRREFFGVTGVAGAILSLLPGRARVEKKREELMRKVSVAAFVAIVCLVTGCDDSPPSMPLAPSALPAPPATPPQPPAVSLVRFTDPASGFSTSDVHDVQGQIVHFSTADELIWVADGTRFAEFLTNGNLIGYHHRADTFFQIRFGTRDGRQAAFITWPDRPGRSVPTILDLWVDETKNLKVADTDVPVPGT